MKRERSQSPVRAEKRAKSQEDTGASSSGGGKPGGTGIPVFRGSFKKKFLKKHASLVRESWAGVLVTTGVGREAKAMTAVTTLMPKLVPEVEGCLHVIDCGCSGNLFLGFKRKAKQSSQTPQKSEQLDSSLAEQNDVGEDVAEVADEELLPVGVDPDDAVRAFLKGIPSLDVKAKDGLKNCEKYIPVHGTGSSVTMEEVSACISKVLDQHLVPIVDELSKSRTEVKFAINARLVNAKHLDKSAVINAGAQAANKLNKQGILKVDLKHPDLTIHLRILKSAVFVGVSRNVEP